MLDKNIICEQPLVNNRTTSSVYKRGGGALKKDKKVFYTQIFSKYLLIEYNQYSAMVTD